MDKKIKEKIKRHKKIATLASFIIVLLAVGMFMQSRLESLLQNYTEKQVTRHAGVLAELLEEKINTELQYLENMSAYIESRSVESEGVLAVFEEARGNSAMGLLELGGKAVYGESLEAKVFSGIQDSFRGHNAVCYSTEKGLLFTVPVYSNENVRYVLYELYENAFLAEAFGIRCYDGKGIAFVTNRDGQVVIPSTDGTAEKEFFTMQTEMQKAFETVIEKMNISTAASGIYEQTEDSVYLFIAEIGTSEFLLVGTIAEEIVSEGISYITILIWWVYGLLLLFLAIGLYFLFGAEEKAMESEELRKAKMIADSANKAKRDFLANMSHEIRTPINAVLGMNEMIIRECQEEIMNQENVREYALNMQNANKALLALINDILDFSKIEAGKMEITEDEYQLSFLLNDVINMIQVKAEQKNLEFFVKIDEKLPNILYGDIGRIRQVIVNILNNAVKYTNEGHVQMLVGQEMQEKDRILLKIVISDTGIGIRKEDMGRLFGDFERLDMKKNRNVEGTGLGLAITNKLMELMDGNLNVESVYGMGSTFTISLPQKVISEERIGNYKERFREYAKATTVYKQQFMAPEAKILVVDDNSMNLFVVEKLLQKTEVQVVSCMSGEQCLQMAANACYDVILLDHMMPGMDGVETLKKLKEMKENRSKDAAVIALTANAIVGAKESYMEAGFDDYLSKPIDGNSLEELLEKYIPEEKMVKQAETEPATKASAKMEGGEENMSMFNKEIGLYYSMNSEEVYQEFLEIFCSIKEDKTREIVESYEKEDWANYGRHVHSLKSTAKNVGAMKLSDAAYELEKASREGRHEFIHANHDEMLRLFEQTVEEAFAYLENVQNSGI
uniref:ATP-binding protein n=1 Tax=Agathobacter sp. TaxID=2021311 RepID=UPI0040574C8A